MRRQLASLALLGLALVGLTLVGAGTARAAYTTIVNNGPASNRVDIVFLGDGYTSTEMDVYQTHIDAMMTHLFDDAQDPFPRYESYFNAHKIEVISQQSGADDPSTNHYVDTALNASYLYDGVTDRLLYVSEFQANRKVTADLGGAFTADMKYVTVNSTKYGGGGGGYAVYAGGNSEATEIALHEVGHSFAGLADQYGGDPGTYSGGEPSQPDVTTNPTGAKWERWLGYNQPGIGVIGAYEGAWYHNHGVYRPSLNSKMRSLGRPFDAIGREEIILDIYRIVDPLDAWLGNAAPLTDPASLWVDSIDPTVIQHEWFVNGSLVPGATGEEFDPRDFGFGPGTYTVTAHNFDPTDWVRSNFDLLKQDISWTVNYTVPVILGDMDSDGDVDNFDISRLSYTLTDPEAYLAAFGLTDYEARGDIDGDGDFDNFDIQPFEALLTSTNFTAVPEPSTMCLMGMGARRAGIR